MGTSTVTFIPARNRMVVGTVTPKLKVAAYCRVSTDSEEQATSYEAQVEHYTKVIKGNDEWEFAGIYADDGISGTNTKKREEFNRMIEDCMSGKIDKVITKSISRFARNTLDCLQYIRQLKEQNIPVYFEKENIDTMDTKGEVLLTIMASLAQQESQSLSQNVKLGIQFRYQQGQVQVNHNRFLGYTKDENKQLIIDPEQAVVVKRIYYEYLEGKSLIQIARGLEQDEILTAAGKEKWRPETIKKILQNEKYIGDALLQKTYTVDFLTKKRVKNTGIMPQYYVENCHEAIIPRDLYMRVQEEMSRRGNLRSGKTSKKRVYSSKYALSSIVCCARCGDIYRRIQWNNRGKHSTVWRCSKRVEHGPGECGARTILESDLHQVVVIAINRMIADRTAFLPILQGNIELVLQSQKEGEIEALDIELEELQKQLLERVNERKGYEDVAEKIDKVRQNKEETLMKKAGQETVQQRIVEMMVFLEEQMKEVEEYDESLVRKLIQKVTVHEERYVVEFKSGMEIEVEM